MKNPDKVIDALTEKIERLERDLLFAKLERDQLKKTLEQHDKVNTRPAAEKAEEIR